MVVHSVLATGELRFEVRRLQGLTGATSTLALECELTALGFYPGAAAILFADVYAWFSGSHLSLGATRPAPVVLGYPQGQGFVGQPDLPSPVTEQLHLDLSSSAVMRLEELRAGGELKLQLQVTCLLTSRGCAEPDVPPPPGQRVAPSNHPVARWSHDRHVTREEWFYVLEGWGAGIAIPLGVAIPDALPGRDRALVVVQLRDGLNRMHNGDFKGSMAASRQVVEVLRKMLGEDDVLPKGARQRTAHQRRRALAQSLFDLTSAPAHSDDHVRDEAWSREDALLALASAAALAQRVFRA
jgi:hypothetical protein